MIRTKLLIMSSAALLAGTVLAAGQSVQGGGDREKGASSSPGQIQGQSGKEQSAPNRNAQPSPRGQAEGKEKSGTAGAAQRDQDKAKGQTQGQADQDKLKGQAQGDQDKLKSKTQGQNQRDQDKAKTQGQAPREQERQGQTQQGQTQQGQTQREQDRTTTQQGAREGGRGGNVAVSFTTEQRTKIRDTVFKERDAPRLSKADFSVREGTVIPRTVRVVEVPDVIVEVHPEWRGYRYFIVNEELVIVDPSTLRIVAVVEV